MPREANGQAGFVDERFGKSLQFIVGKELPVQMCTVKNEHNLSLELPKGTQASEECLEVAFNLETILVQFNLSICFRQDLNIMDKLINGKLKVVRQGNFTN